MIFIILFLKREKTMVIPMSPSKLLGNPVNVIFIHWFLEVDIQKLEKKLTLFQ